MKWLRISATLLFGIYFLRHLFTPYDRLFVYNIDFVFHEAGHFVFGILGDFPGLLGGTLMQLLLPTAAMGHFIWRRQFHSATLVLYWLGENWINISIYARDARARQMPLHGGENVLHDWSEILMKVNLLHYDQAVGNVFFILGALCMVAALAGGIYFSVQTTDSPE